MFSKTHLFGRLSSVWMRPNSNCSPQHDAFAWWTMLKSGEKNTMAHMQLLLLLYPTIIDEAFPSTNMNHQHPSASISQGETPIGPTSPSDRDGSLRVTGFQLLSLALPGLLQCGKPWWHRCGQAAAWRSLVQVRQRLTFLWFLWLA